MTFRRAAGRLLFRFVLLTLAVFVAYAVGGFIMGVTGGSGELRAGGGSSGDAAGAALFLPLLGVCALEAFVLLVLLERARWGGWKLAGVLFVLIFGVETVLSQLETLFFGAALDVGEAAFLRIVVSGGCRALLVAAAAVLVGGRIRSRAGPRALPAPRSLSPWGWVSPVLALAGAYVVIYVLFGYFVAWQVEEVRIFYSGSGALQPFLAHVHDRMLTGSPGFFPFQLFRGALWAGLAFLVVRMTRGGAAYHALATALLFGGVLSGLCLIPNPYLPAGVRMAHFVEILSSMLLFGALAGWVLSRWGSRGREKSILSRAMAERI